MDEPTRLPLADMAEAEERDKLNADNILQQQLVMKKADKLKAETQAQKVVSDLNDLKAEIEGHKLNEKKLEDEIERLGKLWEESADVHGVEIRTRGMSTLCTVEDGKWYRVEVDDNVECPLADEEPTSPILSMINEEGPKVDKKNQKIPLLFRQITMLI
ncbi:putative tudor domain-containing protein 6-like isoform X1 [Sesbania bispinosa]|nr:putative tudor domain-containing protein 6-like isoform X1 [Sesbania bispinosa]